MYEPILILLIVAVFGTEENPSISTKVPYLGTLRVTYLDQTKSKYATLDSCNADKDSLFENEIETLRSTWEKQDRLKILSLTFKAECREVNG